MNKAIGEFLTVLRCGHLATDLSSALTFIRKVAPDVARTFHVVVSPVINETVSDPHMREHLRAALLFASVKGSYLMCAYARMVGAKFPLDVVVLAGSFARLYDDLIDEVGGDRLEDRLAEMFRHRRFVAQTPLERLLWRLYVAIDHRVERPTQAIVYETLNELHRYQVLSRRQRDPSISGDALEEITAHKGGLAVVVLFALVRPRMGRDERDLAMQLGQALQLLDDYFDVTIDLRNGITTQVTRGDRGLVDIAKTLRTLSPRLLALYGHAHARQFITVFYLMVVFALLQRYTRLVPRPITRRLSATENPLWILLRRGGGARDPGNATPYCGLLRSPPQGHVED